jgi:tetratricopeptide (TPR) repeat protein
VLAAALAPVVLACAPTDDVVARYHLERRLWRAQFFQRRINLSLLQASRHDTRQAIDAYRQVIADDPLADPRAASWRQPVVDDIRRIHLSSRIALANLYFLSERYADAGTLYRETVELGALPLRDALEVRLGAARSMYMAGESNAALDQCAQLFQSIVESPEFWSGSVEIDPVFLNIPVVLVRMYRESGALDRYEEYARLAEDFYARLATTRAGTPVAEEARLGRVQLHMVREQWAAAAAELEAIVASLGPAGNPGPALLLGEIHAFALNDTAAARPLLEGVIQAHPETDAAFAARYDLIELRLTGGDEAGALLAFRDLEDAPGAPEVVVSRCMLTRARVLEKRGDWDEALSLLRRIQQLYPFSPPAIETPMIIVRHYMDRGETNLAERSLDRAREYYLSLIDRHSRFAGDRLTVQGALASSYVMSGRAGEVAQILASGGPEWDEEATASGMLKAGELYETVLDDRPQAVSILKKCIERFPETRYARVAQRRLDELEGRP